MRSLALIAVGAGLLACSSTPDPVVRSAGKQAEYLRLTEGKVAGTPTTCLPAFGVNDMKVIDQNTVVFRESRRKVYVARLSEGCSNLGQRGYVMLTRQVGRIQICQGEVVRIIDAMNGLTVGSCAFSEFTPYSTPAG